MQEENECVLRAARALSGMSYALNALREGA
jgi:hypothetical protein